jgi:glutamate-5-semialdehyde dehydrogenase
MVEVPVKLYMDKVLKAAHHAVRSMAQLSSETKSAVLLAMAERIAEQEEAIVEINDRDVKAAGKSEEKESAVDGESYKDRVKGAVDRVRLAPDDLKDMCEDLRRIAELPDPIGEVTFMQQRPNGMQVSRVRSPLGVIGVISEFGPRIMTTSVALCLKSGNVCVYRGGPEWGQTTAKLAELWRDAAAAAGVPEHGLTLIERPEKEAAIEMFRQAKWIDALIVKGYASLRKAVVEQSRIPILCHDFGVSIMYIDGEADLPLAQNIVVNSKIQLASAGNSIDTLLVHQATARPLVPALIRRLLDEFKVEVRACPKTVSLIGAQSFTSYKVVQEATDADYAQQCLSPLLAIKVVNHFDEALDHMAQYSPLHTAGIVTRDYANAMRFTREADAPAVMVNASTRLHDGEEFGMGRQIGVGTGRMHARGPITLDQLTCEKYVVLGTGQLRHPHPVPVTYEDAIMLKRPS